MELNTSPFPTKGKTSIFLFFIFFSNLFIISDAITSSPWPLHINNLMKIVNKSIKFFLLIDIGYYLSIIKKKFIYISISN